MKINNLGPAKTFLGIDIHRNRSKRQIFLTQQRYISTILTRFGIPINESTLTPNISPKLARYDGQADLDTIRQYQQEIGSILYVSRGVNGDSGNSGGALNQVTIY